MASDDNPLQPLIDPSKSDDSLNLRYTESLPPTTINMTPNSTSSKKKRCSSSARELRRRIKMKEKAVRDMLKINLSRGLALRKELQNRLSLLTDIMCVLALLGIILMIIENEIKFAQIYNQETPASWALKLIITISTIFLVLLVLVYHRLDLNLYAVNHAVKDWHIGLTYRKIILIIVEMVICALHPLVPAFPKNSTKTIDQLNANATLLAQIHDREAPTDVILSLMMFFRLYLLFRFAVYHSHLTRNVGHQSLGYLNQVSINSMFLIKTTLTEWPTSCLSISLITVLFIGSWALRACDSDSGTTHRSMVDTMWFFIVTFTTVGYGDMIPATYCGRVIAVMTVFVGLFSSALLIAVVAQKLQLDRWEKYLHEYVLNIELAKQHKIQAANIIKFSMKLWTAARSNGLLSRIKYFHIKRQIFHSINAVQSIKKKQRELVDAYVGLPEVAVLERAINTTTEDTIKTVENLELKMNNFENQLLNMKESIDIMQNTLKLLVDMLKRS